MAFCNRVDLGAGDVSIPAAAHSWAEAYPPIVKDGQLCSAELDAVDL